MYLLFLLFTMRDLFANWRLLVNLLCMRIKVLLSSHYLLSWSNYLSPDWLRMPKVRLVLFHRHCVWLWHDLAVSNWRWYWPWPCYWPLTVYNLWALADYFTHTAFPAWFSTWLSTVYGFFLFILQLTAQWEIYLLLIWVWKFLSMVGTWRIYVFFLFLFLSCNLFYAFYLLLGSNIDYWAMFFLFTTLFAAFLPDYSLFLWCTFDLLI